MPSGTSRPMFPGSMTALPAAIAGEAAVAATPAAVAACAEIRGADA